MNTAAKNTKVKLKMIKTNNNEAGKGDRPRNCFTQNYRNNYDKINWNKKNDDKNKNINDGANIANSGVPTST